MIKRQNQKIINGSAGCKKFIDKNTDPGLRRQIMLYHSSGILTDKERAKLLGLPDGCRIRENAKIISPENFKCGENVWIGEGAVLDASGGLEIGDNTQIGLYALVWSHTSRDQAISGQTGTSRDKIVRQKTKIGKNCFIGGPCVIYPGVTIGDRATILPMSAVNKDIEADQIAAGAPVGKLKEMDDEIARLKERISQMEKTIK
jgi:acetyltransferase-like isoleucine patch superfamily enzyme